MHEHHALVPNADRSALLLVGGRLPVVRVEERRLQATLAALEREVGVRAWFLRVVRRVEEDERLTTLFEVDPPKNEPRGVWLPVDDVDATVVSPVFAEGVARWLAEQRGAPIPAERPPWARAGWHPDAFAWVADHVRVTGEPELIRQWPLSAVYRFDTAAGAAYFKAVFPPFRHEPAVSAVLAGEHPGDVPDVIAVDEDRGWMLTREVPGDLIADREPSWGMEGVRAAARIQRAWVGRVAELGEAGAPSRGLDALRAAAPALAALCDRLAGCGIPDTIVHGDLHQWNAIVSGDRVVVLDWSDAAIGHPFLDLGPYVFFAEADRTKLVDAYVEPWSGVASRADLLAAAALGEVLGCVYQAVSYRAINAAFERDDRWVFAGEYDAWMERAHQLAETL